MNYTMRRTGLNSVEFKTDKGVTVKMNFNTNDNYEVEFEINQEYIDKSGIEFVDLPVEAEPEEPKKQEEKQPLLKQIGKYLLEVFKKLKNKLWR